MQIGRRSVAELREALRPKQKQTGEMILLGDVLHDVKFFGLVTDGETPEMLTATLTFEPQDDAVMSLNALVPADPPAELEPPRAE